MVPLSVSGDRSDGSFIDGRLRALRRRISSANSPGNLEGLFAYCVMAGRPFPDLTWDVSPLAPTWLDAHEERFGHAPTLAALGYGMSRFRPCADGRLGAVLRQGLTLLQRRDPFPGDRMTFIHALPALYGIALGAKLLQDESPELSTWLLEALHDRRLHPVDRFQELMHGHIRAFLGDDPVVLANMEKPADASELALAFWMAQQGTGTFVPPDVELQTLQRRLMRGALDVDESDLSIPRAALFHFALDQILETSIDQLVLGPSHVGQVLRRFEAAMRRWRWDDPAQVQDPIQWKIVSEREVQDILWLILRSVFDEIVDEETLPRVGHSTYRADFGLPRMGVLIEVKYARSKTDFKKVEKEVMEDSTAYLRGDGSYKEIIVFIYDASASVQEHDMTVDALLGLESISDVIIVSRPSGLAEGPAPPPRTRRRRAEQ